MTKSSMTKKINMVSSDYTDYLWSYYICFRWLLSMQGKVNEEKVDSFNLPIFFSPLKDLKKILESNEYFTIEQMETVDAKKSFIPVNVDMNVYHHRAALEGLIQNHFGVGIVDELFNRFTKKVKEFPDAMDIRKLNIVALFVLLKRKLDE